jgi:hypothetical protein
MKPNIKNGIKRAPGLALGAVLGTFLTGKMHKGVNPTAPFKDAQQAGIVAAGLGLIFCGNKGMIGDAAASLFAVGVATLAKKPLGIAGADDVDLNGIEEEINGYEDINGADDTINGIDED